MKIELTDLSAAIQEEVNRTRLILNSTISKDAAVQRDVYIDVSGERALRRIRFKLIDSEDGGRNYQFDCLP